MTKKIVEKIFKKIIILTIILSATTFTFAQSTDSSKGFQYEMVSFPDQNPESKNSAVTPFLNLDFLNHATITINYANLSNGFQSFFDLLIGISIATAVIVFMLAAFQGIVEGDNSGKVKKGREGMQNAVVGLMIILSTWLIINTINPDLLRLPIFQGLEKIGNSKPSPASGDSNQTSNGVNITSSPE